VTEYLQIVTSVDSQINAQIIADALVSSRLAACVQVIGPISSTYWWEDEMETVEEWQCIVKTRSDMYDEVERVITLIHPYKVPEILATSVKSGNSAYLRWMDAELTGE
jgi:periplasmic divalent cation tolerance protein